MEHLQKSNLTIGSLLYLAKEGDIDKYNTIRPSLYVSKDLFDDGHVYTSIEIDTPYLMTKTEEINTGQSLFKDEVKKFMKYDNKSLVLKSRYGSGKTAFMQKLIENTIQNVYCLSPTGKHWHVTS